MIWNVNSVHRHWHVKGVQLADCSPSFYLDCEILQPMNALNHGVVDCNRRIAGLGFRTSPITSAVPLIHGYGIRVYISPLQSDHFTDAETEVTSRIFSGASCPLILLT